MKRSAVVFYLYPTTRQPLTDAILRLSEVASLWGYKIGRSKLVSKTRPFLGDFIHCCCFYITKFKYHLCYYLNLFAILAKGTVW